MKALDVDTQEQDDANTSFKGCVGCISLSEEVKILNKKVNFLMSQFYDLERSMRSVARFGCKMMYSSTTTICLLKHNIGENDE